MLLVSGRIVLNMEQDYILQQLQKMIMGQNTLLKEIKEVSKNLEQVRNEMKERDSAIIDLKENTIRGYDVNVESGDLLNFKGNIEGQKRVEGESLNVTVDELGVYVDDEESREFCENYSFEEAVNEEEEVVIGNIKDIDRDIKGISDVERREFSEMLLRNRSVFSDKPGELAGYTHTLETIDHEPFYQRSYPTSFSMREDVANVLDERSRKLNAFSVDGKTYVFTKLPFGLKISCQVFVQQFDLALTDEIREFTTIYVDDIVVGSESFGEHLQQLDKLFSQLRKEGLTININKTQFAKSEISFLGNLVSERGAEPFPEKIKKIKEMPSPRKVKHLKQLIGYYSFYKIYLYYYSSLLQPLYQLLMKGVKFKWEEKHEVALDKIKDSFANCIVLAHPMEGQDYILRCDVSLKGIAAILSQVDVEGHERIISLASRGLKNNEVTYTISELELLKIVFATQKFRTYIFGRKATTQACLKKVIDYWIPLCGTPVA